jgi:subtilisin family serine protease
MHAVTYSSNSNREKKVATTDVKNQCTTEHSGTSAAAPIAAGILALTLEAKYGDHFLNFSFLYFQKLIIT